MKLTISDLVSIREELKDMKSTIGSYYDSRLNSAKDCVASALSNVEDLIHKFEQGKEASND